MRFAWIASTVLTVACMAATARAQSPPGDAPSAAQETFDAQELDAPPSEEQRKTDAEKHFRAGVSLQKVEDFEAAIAAYEASLRLYPTKSALFNLANCLRATHRYPEALEAFERLQRKYADELSDPMRSAAARQAAELRNLTATVALEVRTDTDALHAGATVEVDGRKVGTTPLEGPLRLALGDHEISVVAPGYEPARIRVNLGPDERAVRQVRLQPSRADAPKPAADSVEPAAPMASGFAPAVRDPGTDQTDLASWGWISLGTGAALLVGGAVTGVWALSVDGDLDSACPQERCPSSEQDDVDKLGTLTTTTNVLLGVGAAAAVAGVVLLWLDEAQPERQTQPVAVDVLLGDGVLGAVFRQRF